MAPDPNLLVIVHLLAGRPAAAAEALGGGMDPQSFTSFVDQQHLRFYLSRWIEQGTMSAMLPAVWAARVVKAARQQRARQERLVAELARAAAVFDGAGIDYMLLKGPYLADRFYGGTTNRSFIDLDLLVHRDELERAGRTLESAGYAEKSRLILGVPLMARFAHAFDYATTIETPHGQEAVTIDLHWALSIHPSFRIGYERIWREQSVWLLQGRKFAVLSDEDEVLVSILTVLRDGERGAARLKLFVDLFHILQVTSGHIDWARFFERRASEGLLRPSLGVLDLFFELLQCRPLFPALADALEARRSKMPSVSKKEWLLRPAALPVRHKMWSASLYECSPVLSLAWWSASLPFRLMVYQRGRFRRRVRSGLKSSLRVASQLIRSGASRSVPARQARERPKISK